MATQKYKITTRQLLIIFVPSVFVLVVIAISCFAYDVQVIKLTRDPLAIFNKDPLYGFLSNLGVLFWSAAASVCFFSAYTLWGNCSKKIVPFLFHSGLLSLYLLGDDLFQFHEYFFDKIFGINEKIVYGILATVILIYLVSYRRLIIKTNFVLLLLAIGFLGFSVISDAILAPLHLSVGNWGVLFEDGTKWLGIVSWCSYFLDTSYHALKKNINLPAN